MLTFHDTEVEEETVSSGVVKDKSKTRNLQMETSELSKEQKNQIQESERENKQLQQIILDLTSRIDMLEDKVEELQRYEPKETFNNRLGIHLPPKKRS